MTGQKIFNGVIIGLLVLGLALTAAPALANGELPNRNPPPPTDNGGRDDSGPLGASIELMAWPPGGMSVVQWQDVNGNWHDVEGWRGALDSGGRIRWWVAAKDFGTGPFRWVAGESVSEPFNLPGGAAAPLQVSLP
jgi:hypothetical protein